MKKVTPTYPIFIAAFPIINLYSLNLAMVPAGDVVRPLLIAIALLLLSWCLASLVLRSLTKGALLSALLIALFFSFGPLNRFVAHGTLEGVEGVLVLAVGFLLFRTKRDLSLLTRALNFGACVFLVIPLAQIVLRRPPGHQTSYLQANLPTVATSSSVAEKPDVFFVILDGYGRADQLQRVMGYSNDGFLQDLRSRGFYVADRSHSNYCQTQLSLSATLNLSFLQDYPKVFAPGSDDREPLRQGMDKSWIAGYMKRLGYVYVSVTSGFHEVRFPSANVVYDRPLTSTLLEDALIQLTPIPQDSGAIVSKFNERRKNLLGAIQNLTSLATPTVSPRFIVAHLLAPHPPFVFDADGHPLNQKLAFGYWDGSHYEDNGGTRDMYRDGYVGQVQYLNKLLLPMIDQIIAKARVKPVIIVEGDHGSKCLFDQEEEGKTDAREVFSNLVAIYAPDSVKSRLYPSMTSVNTFRVVLDGLFRENLPMLPDKSFYSGFSIPYRFTDETAVVTGQPAARYAKVAGKRS